ncbi:MAG: S1 family peptidase, partial [Myxococcota bacterium]
MILNPTNALSWRRRLRGIALPVLGALLLQTLGATASEPRRFPRIVNGLETADFPATGALLYSSFGSMSSAPPVCTGTLIGCQTFLTASHCFALDEFDQDLDPSHYFVFLQHAGFFAIDSIALHPDYATVSGGVVTAWGDAFADVAVAHLSSAVTAISPRALLATDPYKLIPEGGSLAGTIAGFGTTGGGNDDLGLKRWGHVAVADCPTQIEGETVGEKLLCWEFADPIGAAGEDSNTCGGDSGGPLFFEIDGEVQVAGITQAGLNFNCLPAGSIPDTAWDASVYYYRSFIETELGSDSTTACGGLPDVGSASAPILAFDGSLGPGGKSAEH